VQPDNVEETTGNNILGKCTAANERFGATAAGRADLKGSAEKPPLRQAAIPLCASMATASSREYRLEKGVQLDNVLDKGVKT